MNVFSSTASDIIVERTGSLGRIRLNRPKALNSLTLEMVRSIAAALDRFGCDSHVAAVLLTGEGERGLCAGGDIRALYESGRKGDGLAPAFWREEYRLNAQIARFSKPYIAIMEGITMGGGVGLSAHGSHRVVTERTRIAMPETGIGFVPDVGGSWLLSHAPGEFGTFLGLTGEVIGAKDAIFAGLADFEVPSAAIADLIRVLAVAAPGATSAEIRAIIKRYTSPPGPGPLQEHRSMMDHTMASNSVEKILSALEGDGSAFARKTRATILAKSPTSIELTLRLIRLGRASHNLEDCLEREFVVAVAILKDHDFYEGVRAAVIDKDRNPRWSPPTLAEVDRSKVDACLASPIPQHVFPYPRTSEGENG